MFLSVVLLYCSCAAATSIIITSTYSNFARIVSVATIVVVALLFLSVDVAAVTTDVSGVAHATILLLRASASALF